MSINSVAIICPDSHRATLNALGEAMGYGPDNWNVPLSSGGRAPATHWGTAMWEQPGSTLHGLRLAVQAGQIPPGLEPYDAALRSLLFRLGAPASENWRAALHSAGLAQILEDEG